MIGRIAQKLLRRGAPAGSGSDLIGEYLRNGRVPWSRGYAKYKNRLLEQTLSDRGLMEHFAAGAPLPEGYGEALDERVVEIPWALSRLRPGNGPILDAGSVLNAPFLLARPQLSGRRLFVFSLELDHVQLSPTLSYIHGDFREPLFREALFDSIICISTLEHVGMWPIPKPPFAQSLARPQPAKDLLAYRLVLAEFFRLLAPGGQLLLTVPIGRKEDQDWLQIFSPDDIEDIRSAFGGRLATVVCYLHRFGGWKVVNPQDCAHATYYNFVKTPEPAPDGAAAARAVACLEMVRPR